MSLPDPAAPRPFTALPAPDTRDRWDVDVVVAGQPAWRRTRRDLTGTLAVMRRDAALLGWPAATPVHAPGTASDARGSRWLLQHPTEPDSYVLAERVR